MLIALSVELKAQYYSTGQDPASAKWSQIKTENFQVIFQKQFINQAQKVANILESNYISAGKSLDHKPKKISVILHNQSMISNGYVVWAPKRMELSTTPPQNSYPEPWLEHLCIHELRHVVQVDKLNQGITKALSIVFGQQAVGLVAGQLPLWYLEGDAVSTETAFTDFGRGRLPFFEKGIKTHLLSDENRYSFDKMLFGSYKDYVPNNYELGYQLTSYARAKYKPMVWSNVENYVARNSYTLLPTSFAFYKGLKKNIGLSQEELFKETFDHLDSLWTKEAQDKDFNEIKYFQVYDILQFENYLNPIAIDDNRILALKKGKSHIPQFVLLYKDIEQIIYEPGYLISNDFSFANNIVVWAEYKPDQRWSNREYTSIRMLNINTQKEKTLVKKSRYFAPEFSPNAEKIAVVEVDDRNKSTLVLLDAINGSVLQTISTKNDNFIQRPQWSKDEKFIYVIEQENSSKKVSRYNFELNNWEFVFKLEGSDIQKIRVLDDNIYFHSTYNGTDNIYIFDEKSKQIFQLSDSKYGISEFFVFANGKDLISSEYTSQGSRITKIPIERALWENIDQVEKYKYKLADVLSEQEAHKTTSEQTSSKEYDVKPYRKSLNLFNFHSWFPFNINFNDLLTGDLISDPSSLQENIHPGITLLSQNKLSTVESILGYAYKNGNHVLSSSLILKGQYPVVRLTANYGEDQIIHSVDDDSWRPPSNIAYSYDLDIYVPFNFTSGKFIRGLQPLISLEYFDNIYYNYRDKYYIKGLESVRTSLLFYSYQMKAERDIIPKLGAVFEFNLFNTPFETDLFGYQYNLGALFYLPGRNNSGFKIDLGYQFQDPVLYRYNSNFRFPRGIENRSSDKMLKMYGDYIFPIAYPDWNLGSFIYIKRLRGNIFADYAYNTYRTANTTKTAYIYPVEHLFSFGIELTADYHLLRTIFPINTGLRLGYSPSENKILLNIVFGIDLFNP